MTQRLIQLAGRMRDDRGSVMVLVAAGLSAFVLLGAFVIDVGHWYAYSRNLQLRADAAALATDAQWGNICFNNATTSAQTDAIGQVAQQYAGPPQQNPANPYTVPNNLPYSYSTFTPAQYQNVPNLTRGSPPNYHLLLNSDAYWPNGSDWNMESTAQKQKEPVPGTSSLALCGSTDGSHTAPMADVRITQSNIPMFFPLLNFQPTISAHARVELQQIQEIGSGLGPLAIGDPSFTPCAYANFLDNDGTQLAHVRLTQVPNSTVWTNAGSPAALSGFGGDPVTVQIELSNCKGNSSFYYSGTPKGLVYVENWGTVAAPGANGAPALAAGGVKLTGGVTGTTCDPYFETNPSGCTGLGVDANVAFQPSATLSGPSRTAFLQATVASQTINLAYTGSGNEWNTLGATSPNSFNIAAGSGPSNVTIQWAQTSGTVTGKGTCNMPASGNPFGSTNPCKGTVPGFGAGNVQQRVFAGLSGINSCGNPPTYDTGPVRWVTVGTTDNGGATAGYNAIPNGGTTAHLYVKASIEGFANAPPTDTSAQDSCLRLAGSQGNGLVICTNGQPGTTGDRNAINNGCTFPMQLNTRVQADGSYLCSPAITPQDCVNQDPGVSAPVLRGFDDRMGSPTCTPNNWPNASFTDPRTFIFLLTDPEDLGANNGQSATIPILGFGVFYVTGWSTGQGGVQGCSNGTNDPNPGSGSGEVWGHFSSIFIPSGSGSGNGTGCDTTQFGDCIAVLTR
jgi:hypothetical protein